MVSNQVKAYTHLWLDHTPGDLTRAPGLTSLPTLLDAPERNAHVRRMLVEMVTEIAELNERVRGLEGTIRELVSPLKPALLEITGISHVSVAVLLAEIGDITPLPSRPSSPATPDAFRSRSTPPTGDATGCTAAATDGSTACSTPHPSSRN
ncbi:hypothetical protein [Streptomyces sp. NPDC005262]|uniref:hypothetical protein n=1 Tax=Streptomyces sp. NPDC005262 TaxID=3364710 RepID=UPI003694AF0C